MEEERWRYPDSTSWEPVSAAQVAQDLIGFVERVLLALEVSLVDTLASEELNMGEVRLLMALERGSLEGDRAQLHADGAHGLPSKLRSLARRGLIERTDNGTSTRLSPEGQKALRRIARVSAAAMTELVDGLDDAQRLRLQGAMHLLSDRFIADSA